VPTTKYFTDGREAAVPASQLGGAPVADSQVADPPDRLGQQRPTLPDLGGVLSRGRPHRGPI
jgi:hypothetical protein